MKKKVIKKRKYTRRKLGKGLDAILPNAAVKPPTLTPEEAIMLDRNLQYGEAWDLTNDLIAIISRRAPILHMIQQGVMFTWTIILNKLIRAIQSPLKVDHWRDIQIYAKLMADKLEAFEGVTGQVPE